MGARIPILERTLMHSIEGQASGKQIVPSCPAAEQKHIPVADYGAKIFKSAMHLSCMGGCVVILGHVLMDCDDCSMCRLLRFGELG